jgi:hypothetical protein
MLVITPGLGGPDNPWWVARQLAVMKLPLVLSGAAAIVWLLDAAGQRRPSLLAAVVGACIGWGFVVHGATDVGAATVMRSLNQARARALEEVVPDRAAIVAYWGAVNPVGPLLFTRDLVAVDIRADQGHDGAAVIQALLAQGRRVFLLNDGMPPELVRRAAGELRLVPVAHSKLPVVELRSSAE